MKKNKKNRKEQIRKELEQDNVVRIMMEMGCTVLHLDKEEDETISVTIFKDDV